jgi:hypothetical protein
MAGAAAAEGMYQVISAADSTILMVMPSQHMATIMNIGTTLTSVAGPMKFESHIAQSHMDDLGAGERILGHPTHHVRVSSEGTIDITMSGQSCTAELNTIAEMWIAPDVDLREALESSLSTYNAVLGGNGVEIPTATRSSLPPGTSLRTISKTTRPNAEGRMTTVTKTMEYVELARGPLDPALFAAPAEVKVMDMRKLMGDLPAGMLDSAMRETKSKVDSSAGNICKSIGGEP